MVFTDGLATVSVFIESASLPPQTSRTGEPRQSSGAAQLGAAAAFTAITDGYRVTAVGEVPPQTVRAIAESLRPVPESAAPLDKLTRQ
jgi:negative regulator of sigma E activity